MVNTSPPRSTPLGGSVILMLGVLSIVMPLIGPFAWSFGNKTIAAVKAGTLDQSEAGTATAGRILGIIGTVLLGFGVLMTVAYLVFTLTVGRMMIGQIQNLTSQSDNSTPAAQTVPGSGHGGNSIGDAIMARNLSEVKSMVTSSPKAVNKPDQVGDTPLFTAAFVGSVPIAKYLIDHGANVNAKDKFGKTPLDNAVFFQHGDVAALLEQHGARRGTGK